MFKKGQSGNPGGVPTRPETLARRQAKEDVREYCRAHSQVAVDALVDVVSSKKAPPSARVAAANALLDRGWGKPQVEITANVNTFEKMNEQELIDYIASKTIDGQAMRVLEEMEQEERDLLENAE